MSTLTSRRIKPLEHSGDSANIAFYRERGVTPGERYVWAEVLCSTSYRVNGVTKLKDHADYYVTVFAVGEGEIGKLKHTTQRRLGGSGSAGSLSARTVAGLVRRAIA